MRYLWIILLVLFAIPGVPSATEPDKPILGFTDKQVADQLALESKFDSYLKAENLREWMKHLTARPHHIGSPYAKENAQYMYELFTSWGYQTQIEEFDVLFPTPKVRVLEMIAPETYKAELQEPAIKEDSTSNQQSEQLPTYNAYSIDGDVTGELVYVNYGVPSDYDELDLRGIDVKRKNRDRPLWRVLAGRETESCCGKGRHWLHHIFGSER